MPRYQDVISWSVLLAGLGGVQAKLDLNSTSNIVVYWGQNSLQGKGGEVQQSLGHYCDSECICMLRTMRAQELTKNDADDDIDVIPIAFDMMINGPGGAPEVDFSVTSQDCDVFEGTQLKNCPKIGQDIASCQKKDKTILLSIGGATYSEGGFQSEKEAKEGAQLIWETFGPKAEGSKALRPFGDVSLDGFDFDFEANVQNMAPFANELRSLMDKETDKQYFLTAAPQCPYPDQSDKDILNGPVYIDAIWVQFYNNFCGVNNFNTDASSSKYNFEEWDNWAKTVSKNKDVKVMVGVPADTTAASTGYIPVSKLTEVVQYSKKFESFGGVMMWDATQAYANQGFLSGVRDALGGGGDSGSSSSSNNAASTAASAPSSTNSPNTSLSSNAPASSSSSSSSFGSGSSSSGHSQPVPTKSTTEPNPTPTLPTLPTLPTTLSTAASTKPVVEPSPKPPAHDDDSSDAAPNNNNNNNNNNNDTASPAQPATPAATGSDNSDKGGPVHNLLSSDLFGLLKGIRQANDVVGGVTNGLTKNLRRGNRIAY
ncbi:uncharacterized protein N7459_008226 [Penicillium hispanicum]|uniref:uncharacterized protein n=1 Tax=Penicillium hispanicum TaxID=1080232 RepID=UPI002540F156|nr:uncharacterized protein N7459_008226 [Penicillium hispanicum]KAJ5573799.1 hypothetical protein N7459_008226 [Penicillium hispanicum]